jgi:hypothetical protein
MRAGPPARSELQAERSEFIGGCLSRDAERSAIARALRADQTIDVE